MEKYKCSVCGYVYDTTKGDADGNVPPNTPFHKLPDSWVCPVCGAPKDMFEKVQVEWVHSKAIQKPHWDRMPSMRGPKQPYRFRPSIDLQPYGNLEQLPSFDIESLSAFKGYGSDLI